MNFATPICIGLALSVVGCGSAASTSSEAVDRTLSATAQTDITLRDTVQQLSTSVKLTNDSALPVHLEYGACAVRVLAFRAEARAGAPVWNSDYRAPYHASYTYGCTAQLILADLQPGKSLDFGFQGPLIELVGDSLPNGRYYLAADLLLSNRPGFLRIPAGSVDVALAR
jgi:hypothetical protein